MLSSTSVAPDPVLSGSLLDELAREVAQRILAAALKAEADVPVLVDQLDEDGDRLVVRNGHYGGRGRSRSGRPRVNDTPGVKVTGERQGFASALLPAWCRRSPKVGRHRSTARLRDVKNIRVRDEPSTWLVQLNRIPRVSRRNLRRSARRFGLSLSAYG